jgi:hypothetical protein
LQALSPAVQLRLLAGLLPYRDTLQRDIVFVSAGSRVMAESGANELVRMLLSNNPKGQTAPTNANGEDSAFNANETRRRAPLLERKQAHDMRLIQVSRIEEGFSAEGFLRDPDATARFIGSLPVTERRFLQEQGTYVLNTIAYERLEPQLQARLRYLRAGKPGSQSEDFKKYFNARRAYTEAESAGGYQLSNLAQGRPEYLAEIDLRRRVQARFTDLREHHEREIRRIDQELALVKVFSKYGNIGVFEPRVIPAMRPGEEEEVLCLNNGTNYVEPELLSILNVMASTKSRLQFDHDFVISEVSRTQLEKVAQSVGNVPRYLPTMFSNYGYSAYSLVNLNRRLSYDHYFDPVVMPFMHNLHTVRRSLAVIGELVLSLGHGNGNVGPVTPRTDGQLGFGGRVLASDIGHTIVPNYPLVNALVASRPKSNNGSFSYPDYYRYLLLMTDVYGRFSINPNASEFSTEPGSLALINLIAASFGPDGLINCMKDEGEEGQRQFKSINIDASNRGAITNVTLATFRASPVSVLDLTNPQTLKGYSAIEAISAHGLAALPKMCRFREVGIDTTFLQPEEKVFFKLQAGAPENPLVKVTRAFLLGAEPESAIAREKEIAGTGYLVADHPFLIGVAGETARSMASVNGKRLAMQDAYGMADRRTRFLHAQTLAEVERGEQPALGFRESVRAFRKAVVFASLNHPVLRNSIFEAVMGILWYLALLVPFVFFFEKLIFCYNDIRRQIFAQAGIFLVVFLLLRVLHPAFAMVRSSLMVLLGFFIILISTALTVIFSSKFQENLEELKKSQGKVAAAEINTIGVVVSAFMLGLNNMHRRRVRTGLTCGTLTLLTFAMISFTSVENDLVEESFPVGKATYQGILVKRDLLEAISQSEVFAMEETFGDRFEVSPRMFYVGQEHQPSKQLRNPEIYISHDSESGVRDTECESVLQLGPREPLAGAIRFLTDTSWFVDSPEENDEGLIPVYLPNEMAERLGISVHSVNQGDAVVMVSGRRFRVAGIFDSESLRALRDIDGRDLLPFDVERMEISIKQGNQILAATDDPRISAEKIIIAPLVDLNLGISFVENRVFSVAVTMPELNYREARGEIDGYLEQQGRSAYYGLDGVAYKGRRTREASIAGKVDLIIPLIIAALTVLNAMKGSVYERRDEIYVYNAVGIAPRYVFFMFFTEAFVYVVVGSILGYLLSQGTGRVLTVIQMTGGLNMTFTSLSTIYASLAIAIAVFSPPGSRPARRWRSPLPPRRPVGNSPNRWVTD